MLQTQINLKGNGVKNFDVIVTADSSISQSDSAIVSAYAGIAINHGTKEITISENHTIDELYDFIKYNKLSNIEQPSVSALLATRNASEVDFGDYSIAISSGATLSKTSKSDTLKTTATITGDTDCSVIDSTQDSQVTIIGVSFTYCKPSLCLN